MRIYLEDWIYVYDVVVVDVMRDELVVPRHASRFSVQCDDGVRVQVRTRPCIIVKIRSRVAAGNVQQVLFGVIGQWSPQRAARVFARVRIRSPGIRARLTVSGNDVELPYLFSIAQFEGADPPAGGPFGSATSDVDQVSVHQRRHTNKVAIFWIRDLFCPQEVACFGVEGDQIVISCAADNLSTHNGGATVGMHEVAIARFPFVATPDVAISTVECDGVMIACCVKNASDRERGRLGRHTLWERVGTNFSKLTHILRSDLVQRAITRPADIVG